MKTLFKAPESPSINAPLTVVLDSTVFKLLIKHNLQYKFYHLALHARSVICCRLSPQEKALIAGLSRWFTP